MHRNLIKSLVLLCSVLSCAVGPLLARNAPGDSTTYLSSILREYDAFIGDNLRERRVPGAAVAIVKGDSVVYLKGFGVREVGRPEPIDAHTVFRISSLSKGFAAILAATLVERGVLDWDDRVAAFLQGFALQDSASTANLTIGHILSHQSGLPAHAYTNLVEANVPYETMVAELNKVAAICPVGECFSYQNVVYSLIGEVIASATGREYAELLEERVLRPLGMLDASLSREALLSNPNHASPHIRWGGRWVPTAVKQAYYSVSPAAGVNASINDLAIWLRALLGGMPEVISPYVQKQVTNRLTRTRNRRRYFHSWPNVKRTYYGLGWRVFDYAGRTMIYHGGYVRGYRSEIAYMPELQIGLAVMLNCPTSLANRCVPAFFDRYLGLREN